MYLATMDLSAGRELSHYRLIEPIGEGGMGVVWRATDTTLGRDVAIKVLPAVFASDPDRMARFEREARMLASLNHPHIAAIYGVGAVEGVRFLAMELVEGDDLAVRLSRGPLAVRETIEMARELAEALEAAHEKGIIHRDLKPANIKLNPEGQVKVLDFGLAKALDPDTPTASGSSAVSMSPTLTSPMTAANVILGTAAYMSPEQARGKLVDRRADIWAFGCVVFECLTSKRPFPGETVSDTIAKILERDPDWSALPPTTPVRLRELLRRCVEKDAKKRLRDIGDARIELDEIIAQGVTPSGIAAAEQASAKAHGGRSKTALAAAVAAAAAAAALTAALYSGPLRTVARPVPMMVTISSPANLGIRPVPALSSISPDGSMIAMWAFDSVGVSRLVVRPLASLDVRVLAGTEASDFGFGMPFWSPNGHTIGYFAEGKLRTVAVAGGAPQVLCDAPDARGGTWGKGDVILFSPSSQTAIYRVSASGGEPVAVTRLDTTRHETAHRFPRFLPDGRHFTYVSLPGVDGKMDTYITELGSSKRTLAVRAVSGAMFAAPGHMVFIRDASLVVQPFSLAHMKLEGEPTRVGVAPDNQEVLGCPPASASLNGTMLYPTTLKLSSRLQWYDRDGRPQGAVPVPAGDYVAIEFSPDGQRAAVLRANSPSSQDLWVVDLVRGTMNRLTTDGLPRFTLHWSGDGNRIAYARQRGAVYDFYQIAANGVGGEQPLYISSTPFKDFTDLSPDDSLIVYSDLGNKTARDIYVVNMKGDRSPVPYLVTPFSEFAGRLSPDKRWMLYGSDESGRAEAYVQSYPVPGNKVQISKDGCVGGAWSADGSEILYFNGRGLIAVTVTRGATLSASEPRPVMTFPKDNVAFAMRPDHQRFLFAIPDGDSPKLTLTLLSGWGGMVGRK
ncbi:MAG: protein kinase [Candidatus Eisenbacteria bacterium]